MKKDVLTPELRRRVESKVSELEAVVAPVRSEHAALTALQAEDESLNAAIIAFEQSGDPNDDAGLTANTQRVAKRGILRIRIGQLSAELDKKTARVISALAGLDDLHNSARVAYREPHLQRITKLLAAFYIQPENAYRAACATDFIHAFRAPTLEGYSDKVAASETAIVELKRLLDGEDPVEPNFQGLKQMESKRREERDQREAQAETEADEHNAARDADRAAGKRISADDANQTYEQRADGIYAS